MKILIRQFLGKNHSWSVIGWNLATSLIKFGHDVHLFSTDGINHLPTNLKQNLIGYTEENIPQKIYGRSPDQSYDCQISYTAMKNFPYYLANGNKNKFGIWCYEWSGKNILPTGFAKNYKFVDKILPPSLHAKQVFLDSGIPEDIIEVIPHGISDEFLNSTNIYKLNTDKKFKVLCNIAQPHLRKNIPGIFEAWGKAFTKQDDVVLVMKVVTKNKILNSFEIDFNYELNLFKKKYPNHAEILIVKEFITNISDLYRACNAFLSMSYAESFLIPSLEALASNKIVLVGEVGGQVDFCNNDNSLLIKGKNIRANPKMMYWESKQNAIVFEPDVNHAAEQLQLAYKNEQKLLNKFSSSFADIRKKYTWDNATKQILSLCKD
jgi:glycosyltransferase involved in cell wall biosynthesis